MYRIRRCLLQNIVEWLISNRGILLSVLQAGTFRTKVVLGRTCFAVVHRWIQVVVCMKDLS